MAQTIYVVQGMTGEYSEHQEWLVKAFRSQLAAQDHVSKLSAWLMERGLSYQERGTAPNYDVNEETCPFDDAFKVDYTGTRYFISETTLED